MCHYAGTAMQRPCSCELLQTADMQLELTWCFSKQTPAGTILVLLFANYMFLAELVGQLFCHTAAGLLAC
jgi:hypothetical protein